MRQIPTIAVLTHLLAASPVWAGSDMNELARMIEGHFDTHLIDPDLPADQRMIDKRVRLDLPNLGPHVFYQQINHREGLRVYRQRVLVLSDASGQVEQRAYALREPQWYVDADARAFDRITRDKLDAVMPDGCEQVWARTGDGFRGYVDPGRCQIVSSRTGKLRRIEAESFVSEDRLLIAERGFDAETGEQLFGTPPGDILPLGRAAD